MRADYHIHTNFSVDSKLTMEEIILKSIELGLDEICFTDHVDYGVKNQYVDKQEVDYPEFIKEYNRLNEIYNEKINIKLGLEFGVQIETMQKYVEDMKQYSFDFVLLSCHQIDNKELWLNQYQESLTQLEYNRGYYAYLYKLVDQFDDFSVVGHMDVIKRYDPKGILDDSYVMDLVDPILKRLIEKNKGLEVNTASFRYNLPDLTPSTRILKRYFELGGRILTIGSDTHRIEQLKDHFEEVIVQIKEIGFTELYRFDKMNPIPYTI